MDHLGNLLNGLKTAGAVKKDTIIVQHSKFKEAIVKKLFELGYVAGFEKKDKKGLTKLHITLAYKANGGHKIEGTRRLSKQSCRLYSGVKNMRKVKQGYGHLLVTTPKGVVTGREAAAAQVGGEVLFEIW